jgi:N utilization substance protein A
MDILQQLNQIAQERDLPLEELTVELEKALVVAYKKYAGVTGEVTVRLDPKKGWSAFLEKEVVGEVIESSSQISLIEARKKYPNVEIGDFVPVEVDPNRFGRIAAQTFKQVLTQKLRDAEHRRIHDVFSEKIGEVVSGTVIRRDEGIVYLQVNRVEAELPKKEQASSEHYHPNDRLRVYVLRVEEDRRVPKVVVSRTHPNLLRKLLELEVPEIQENIVVIKAIAREPGQRSKVSVVSTDERIDAVGACVGQRGTRIQAIMDELQGEKIDIIPYSEDPQTYITNALSPAKINSITLNEEEHSTLVIVPDNQLSLAIGKGGQNVRLAAKLTDWKIDIRSESQIAENIKKAKQKTT